MCRFVVKGLGSDYDSRRNYTFQYNLRYKDELPLRVCNKMFLCTLGLKESMVFHWVGGSQHGLTKKNENSNIMEGALADTSFKKPLSIRCQHLQDWFKSLAKMPSHYCRKRSSRLYLEGPFFNQQEIFNIYKQKCLEDHIITLSKPYFKNEMKKQNLSIYSPKNDLCDTCSSYLVGQFDEDDYANHIALKDRARDEKNNDKMLAKEGLCHVFSMDMQAVQLCPNLKASALYYSMKLKLHNLTIYNIGTKQCSNYWWSEVDGQLEASVFATILIKHLETHCTDKKPIVIYSDGCGYQNRNIVLANALLYFACRNEISIEQKYLVRVIFNKNVIVHIV